MDTAAERTPLDEWKLRLAVMTHRPSILLCGAKRWGGSHDADHRRHVARADWTTTDIAAGDEVDIVADLQTIHETTDRRFDGIFCPAVLEHIERPWCAMYAMSQILAPNGALYIQTHQTFPLHGYPNDFYRFSTEALRSLCQDAGLHVLASGYDGPCTITPTGECAVWNPIAMSFVNVTICAVKP